MFEHGRRSLLSGVVLLRPTKLVVAKMPRRSGRAIAREHCASLRRRELFSSLLFVICALIAFYNSAEITIFAHASEYEILAACTYNRDCMANAYCWNQETCLCMEGHLTDRNRTHVQCLRIATEMGDPCFKDVQCSVTFTPQAECRNKVCACSPGSHFEEGRCYESIGIGHLCQTSHNCYVEGSASFCVDGYCICPLKHHRNSDGTRCLRSSFLGEDCSNDEECIVMDSKCLNVCGCKVGHVLSMDGKRCLKTANRIGDPCGEDKQCQKFLKNARCSDNGKCICNINFKRRGSVCHGDNYTRMLGKHCDTFSDCVQRPVNSASDTTEVTRVDCIDGTCSCAQGYTLVDDRHDCIRFSDINENNCSMRWQIQWMLPAVVFTISRLLL